MSSSPKQQQQQQPTSSLNPSMVHRPLTPPAPSRDSYLRIDESDDPRFRLRIQAAQIVRAILATFTLSSIITFLDMGRPISGDIVPLFVELWFVLVWHLGRLVWNNGRLGAGWLPRISVQIGNAGCVLGGDGGDGRGRRLGKLGKGMGAFVDFAFGVLITTFGSIAAQSARYESSEAAVALAITAGSMMVPVSVFSLFEIYHTAAIEFALYDNGDSQPITLGRPEPNISSRRDPVSISA